MRTIRWIRRFWRRIRRLEVQTYAAYASYFLILAVFPAMMLLIGILQYTPLNPADLHHLLERIIPISLGGLLDYMIEELFAANSVAVLSVTAVIALWMASRGIVSLHRGLNRVYCVRETRSGLRIYLRSILFTLIVVFTLVVLLALNLLSRSVIGFLLAEDNPLGQLLLWISRLKFLLAVLLLVPVFTAMYCALPNRKSSFRDALPGAFSSAVLWVLFSQLFTLYAEEFSNYSIYYGSLAVMAMTMLWLYFCMFILFCGGILNYELERGRNRRKRLEQGEADDV